jgi:hypothetical protein
MKWDVSSHSRRAVTIALSLLMAASSLATGLLVSAGAARRDRPCRRSGPEPGGIDAIAESYVRLALRLGLHDPDYVDAYVGPPEWKPGAADTARERQLPVAELRGDADRLLCQLEKAATRAKRVSCLEAQLRSLRARIDILAGARPSFDDESRALFGRVAPSHSLDSLDAALAALSSFLPGPGDLASRVEAYRARFVIPPDRIEAVMRSAINEARRRTLTHLELPTGEQFTMELVTGEPWSAYNWYRGDFRSVIQVNTDLPVHLSDAVGLACHEGYPGHHVQNILVDAATVRARGWREFSVFPLFSPASLVNEGAAEYGVTLAFPDSERVAFEREVLFPLAGLDPSLAGDYGRFRELTRRLRGAGIECARRYLGGHLTRDEAIAFGRRYGLESRSEAEHSLAFYDRYRSYVINYAAGEDLVRGYIERTAGEANRTTAQRWESLRELAAFPYLPSDAR